MSFLLEDYDTKSLYNEGVRAEIETLVKRKKQLFESLNECIKEQANDVNPHDSYDEPSDEDDYEGNQDEISDFDDDYEFDDDEIDDSADEEEDLDDILYDPTLSEEEFLLHQINLIDKRLKELDCTEV